MKRLLGPIFCLVFLSPWILGNAECNAFLGTADKSSKAALMYIAKSQIDNADYTGALTTLATMTTTDQASHDGRVLKATAYAGRCGLNLVNLANDVSTNIGSKKVMQILLTTMKAATSYTDCTSAETQMLAIAAADMTADDYVFLAFLEFAKIGAALESVADTSDHDGTVDGGFNSCTMAAAVTGDIGVALNVAMNSLTSSGVAILSSSITTTWNSICNATAPFTYPCNNTDPNAFTNPKQLNIIRTLIKANEIGLNTCGGSSYSNGACSCMPPPP